ncbi:diguanylate cyclase [Cellvibrio sp. ARAG 10.3]|uniref:diguanylate cyclase n=1 Tax=Cellvibrio sp. ARAG 10.3 TaxID=3451358 RepID=UPI003F484135
MLRILRLGLVGWLLLNATLIAANPNDAGILHITDTFREQSLTHQLLLLEDPSKRLTIDNIRNGHYAGTFGPPGKNGANLSFTRSAWWVKLRLINESSRENKIILRQAYPLIDYLDLWEHTTGEWHHHKTGDRLPFSQRPIAYHDFLFPLTLPPDSESTLYLRYESEGAMDIALSASSPIELIQNISSEQFAYGVYYGGFLVLVVYNFFIFVVVRDKAFLYYLLYILCFGLYMSANDGFFYQMIMPESPDLANFCLLILLGLSLLFAAQFSRHILTIKQFSRKLDLAALSMIAVLGVVTFSSLFLPYALVVATQATLTLFVMPLIFIMGIARLCSGYPPARYFMLAWSTFIFGIMVYMVKVFGYFPRTFFTENIFQIGSLIEMVLLSLALSSRVNELKKQSHTDALTEIPNRRMFDDVMRQEFQRTQRNGQPFSLLMIDIDHFKQFNDLYGHSQGDRVLKNVAAQLRNLIRKPMMPFRFGGEEFAVILPRTDEKDARIIAERLRQHICSKLIGRHQITVSIGLACQENQVFQSMHELLNAADEALYAAKDNGRNCVMTFSALPDKSTPADCIASLN